MPLNRAVELQKCEHEQADGNQAYSDWSSHECHLGFATKPKCNGESEKQFCQLILKSACSLTSLPVMMIKKDEQQAVGGCMFCPTSIRFFRQVKGEGLLPLTLRAFQSGTISAVLNALAKAG